MRWIVAGVALGVAWGAQAGLLIDRDEEPWVEEGVTFPAPPRSQDLRQFFVAANNPNSYWVDVATLSVGSDGVVRYALVIRSPRGAENRTYEGIRCATGEHRLYAVADANGEWRASRNSEWGPIRFTTYNRAQAALAQDFICDGVTLLGDAKAIRAKIEREGMRMLTPSLDDRGPL